MAKYRKLRAAIDSPFGVPVKGEVLGLGRGYRDPFKFRHSCFPKPRVHPAPCVTYQASKLYLLITSPRRIVKRTFFSFYNSST